MAVLLYCLAKSAVDRPCLVWVLARAWLAHGGGDGKYGDREAQALTALRRAIEWVAAVRLPALE